MSEPFPDLCEHCGYSEEEHAVGAHRYHPDLIAMGDCRVCGGLAEDPVHHAFKSLNANSAHNNVDDGDLFGRDRRRARLRSP